jgi:hypothetical protein
MTMLDAAQIQVDERVDRTAVEQRNRCTDLTW